MANSWQRAIACICIVSFLVTSCTSLHRVSIPGSETTASVPAVQVGDPVVVTTKSGEKKKFDVTAIESDALVGKDIRIPYSDMASLKVRETDRSKTGLVILAVILLILTIVAADGLADEFEDSFNFDPST